MNESEDLPLAIPVKVSAPPFEGDGNWIWIDNTDDIDAEYTEVSKTSWLKNKVNTLIPNHNKEIDKVFKTANKTYKLVKENPEVGLVIVSAGIGVVYVAGKLITHGALYMITPKITVNTTFNRK